MTSGRIGNVAEHPLESMVSGLEGLLAEAPVVAIWTLAPDQLVDLVPRLAQVRNQLEAVELATLRQAERHQVGDPAGHANTAAWFANVTRADKRAAHQAVALAKQLDDDQHRVTREAALRGEVSVEQAAVIIRAVEALPTDLTDPELRRQAEKDLVTFAEQHDPRELRFLGRRILEYRAPDVAEEAERRVLEAEERNAAASASFVMHPDGHGSMLGRFKIPVPAGEILAKHLNAIAAPKHQAAVPVVEEVAQQQPRDRVSRPLKLGAAFVEYLETRPDRGMPRAGGVPATIVVTMTLESLLGGEQAATLDSGERISAAEARRLGCQAGIIPAVLGGRSQPLDVGRKKRFHTEAQRIAIGLRDRGCCVEGCDWPPAMCHIHHAETSWDNGGGTSVAKGSMLCPRHHTLAHDSRYQLKTTKNRKVTFSRRT
jgi:hypothetical protein